MVAATQVIRTDEAECLDDIIKTGEMCIDLETTGLDPLVHTIGLYIIHSNDHTYLFRTAPSWLALVLADPETQKVGFNLKFDYQFLIKHCGIQIIRNTKDLYIDELMVSTERRGLSHNLQATLFRRLGVEISKDVDHSLVDWTGPLSDEMVTYATDDVQYLFRLRDELGNLLRTTRQEQASKIEQDAVFAIAYMTLNGIGVDRPTWEQEIHIWEELDAQYTDQLDNLDASVTNWNSPKQLIEAAQRIHGIKIPNTQKETLNILAEQFHLFEVLLQQRKWHKRVSNWGVEYLDTHMHPMTRRIHPTWWQLNTATGRMSCSGPNLQQVPHQTENEADNVRKLFRAQEGNVISSHDYQQIEMLVAAVMAPDPLLLELFRQGEDTHRYVGSLITGKLPSNVTGDDRQIAKSANFGLLYGAGASTLQRYARKTYNIKLSEQECKRIIKLYFSRFKGLAGMRAYAFGLFQSNPRIIEVRNMAGMRRILAGQSLKPTTWLNTRIQSTAGYGIKRAMHRLTEKELVQYLCLQVHDELVFELPEHKAAELQPEINRCMALGMKDIIGADAPVGIDFHSGKTWAEE